MTEIETRQVDVVGRPITVKRLKDAQYILLSRDAEMMDNDAVEGRLRLRAAANIMDTFETAIVSDEDRQYVLAQTRLGHVELADLMGFMKVFQDDDEATPTPEPKKVVRRGRPRKKV